MGQMDVPGILSAHGPVQELELDDALWHHLRDRGTYAKHIVKLTEIVEVHGDVPKLFVNSSATGQAPIVMVGPTATGRMLCIPLVPTGKWGVWKPVTAFEANTHHREKYAGAEL